MVDASPKKRKQPYTTNSVDGAAKKQKKEKRDKKDSKLKGKERDTEFQIVKTVLVLSIPPIFTGNPRGGVEEMLDSMVMRYIPALRGVVLSHSNIRFLSNTATIQAECPFLVCKVDFDATVWSPHVGMKLVGKVNLYSPDHVSLLLHRTFNVSIPRHHIPKDEWEFEYGPADNDPEFGPDANTQIEGGEGESSSGEQERDGGGKWVHHLTSEKLGGPEGFLEFTVIGLTVANEMLSLLGSIQPDPFSPEHILTTGKNNHAESEIEDLEVLREIELGDEEDEIESDEDTFKALGKKTNGTASAEEMARREAEAEKERKRRRRTERREEKNQRQKRIKS